MLRSSYEPKMSDQDHEIFATLVPADHYLRQVAAVVDFERYRPLMAERYHPNDGRPANDPVVLLKLCYLQTHYALSDRAIISQAQVNMAFRFFLALALSDDLPHPSLLTVFRGRLGSELYEQLFDGLVAQARQAGLVKDRLRLKDATHIIANIAIPSTIRLVAQTRERLLSASEPFAPEQVATARAEALAIRQATSDLVDDERLLQRVTHLRQIVAWADTLCEELSAAPPEPRPVHAAFIDALSLAHKLLADRDDSSGSDQMVSVHDPDARRGKHGSFFTGYLLDVAMDADSQIITALNVLSANADEGADAGALIAHEEAVHGNDVETLSIDKAGFRGELLREWQDPNGLGLEVVVPPMTPTPTPYFTAEEFQHDAEAGMVRCPGGATTKQRVRNRVNTGWKYIFPQVPCRSCPLQPRCLERLPQKTGRQVVVNDYAVEYAAARQKATTERYRALRREHPGIERKLADLVRHHQGRRARYRGQGRVRIQYLLLGLAVNIKRMVGLLTGSPPPGASPRSPYPVANT